MEILILIFGLILLAGIGVWLEWKLPRYFLYEYEEYYLLNKWGLGLPDSFVKVVPNGVEWVKGEEATQFKSATLLRECYELVLEEDKAKKRKKRKYPKVHRLQ
jgi:hypothetical protein